MKNYPDGLDASTFCKKYRDDTGYSIQHPYFGHGTLKAFLQACSDVAVVKHIHEKVFIYSKPQEKGELFE